MRKYYGKYVIASILYFVIVVTLNRWWGLTYSSIWLGAIVGSVLPDIDSLLYVFYVRPEDLSSMRIRKLISEKQYLRAIDMVYKTRSDRPNLLFHSILFQLVFIVFSFYVVSSSGSFFGTGLVLAFLIHLAIDQYFDLVSHPTLDNWMHNFDISFSTNQARYYVYSMFAVLVFLGLVV